MKGTIARVAVMLLLLPFTAARAETPLERGTYLMQSIVACGNCHTIQTPEGPVPGMELAGGMVIEDPAFKVNVPNITPDPETGIGKWTDEQIILAIREGKRPDGSIIGPPMPIGLYRGISDEDAKALVAYLRAVKPVVNKVERSTYPFPLPPNYGPPVGEVKAPPRGETAEYGAYLAGPLGHCIECHSTPNAQGVPDVQNSLGAGGVALHGPWGVSVAPNITPTGLGSWTDDQIKAAITKGVRPDGTRLKPPMAFGYYANIAAPDLNAIVAYLRGLPPK